MVVWPPAPKRELCTHHSPWKYGSWKGGITWRNIPLDAWNRTRLGLFGSLIMSKVSEVLGLPETATTVAPWPCNPTNCLLKTLRLNFLSEILHSWTIERESKFCWTACESFELAYNVRQKATPWKFPSQRPGRGWRRWWLRRHFQQTGISSASSTWTALESHPTNETKAGRRELVHLVERVKLYFIDQTNNRVYAHPEWGNRVHIYGSNQHQVHICMSEIWQHDGKKCLIRSKFWDIRHLNSSKLY